ncbi:hypothetical protein M8C21_007837 [Ambrosia artemisiifolia]|uniref:Inositol oxygenase n=1 Tax=Ambrosia artemisiifolia TaxID=4212 RepID=A0AAD5GM52_AMBAR|nr:hypothetical protein M8C21_007837 [Ambrosia artemisiifolia]
MTVCIDQSVPDTQLVDNKNHCNNSHELVLEGGFMVPDHNVGTGGFDAPEINAFGHTFRDYDVESERQKQVEEFYRMNHINQTYEYVKKIREEYKKLDKLEMSIWEYLGKVLLLPRFGELPQWAVVGDTHPLGCAFDDSIVHHKVAKENGTTLPQAGLFIIRYHSFYPLHRCGAYTHLMNEEDVKNLKWLQIFNKYDLYSKSKVRVDVEKVKPYYMSLIEKYFPKKLRW